MSVLSHPISWSIVVKSGTYLLWCLVLTYRNVWFFHTLPAGPFSWSLVLTYRDVCTFTPYQLVHCREVWYLLIVMSGPHLSWCLYFHTLSAGPLSWCLVLTYRDVWYLLIVMSGTYLLWCLVLTYRNVWFFHTLHAMHSPISLFSGCLRQKWEWYKNKWKQSIQANVRMV